MCKKEFYFSFIRRHSSPFENILRNLAAQRKRQLSFFSESFRLCFIHTMDVLEFAFFVRSFSFTVVSLLGMFSMEMVYTYLYAYLHVSIYHTQKTHTVVNSGLLLMARSSSFSLLSAYTRSLSFYRYH